MEPYRLVFADSTSSERETMLPRKAGKDPESEQWSSSSECRADSFPSVLGIVPTILFVFKRSCCNDVIFPKVEGMEPETLFEDMSSLVSRQR